MTRTWNEGDIAAYVDGALEGAERDRIEGIIQTDPEAQAAAARVQASNALLRDAFAAPLSEPAPPEMAALFDDASVTPFRARPVARARIGGWAPAALAASIALVIGAGGGLMVGPWLAATEREGDGLALGPASETMSQALATTPSGVLASGVRPIASFEVERGFCRELEVEAPTGPVAFGVACGAGDDWRIVFAAALPAAATDQGEGFAPASGAAVDAAVPVLDALGAGEALDTAAELRAIEAGWR
jgi:hypothetical protein